MRRRNSINTSCKSPYDDAATPSGFSYAYRSGSVDQPDNRALRAAGETRAPLVYFVGTRPGWRHPVFPAHVIDDHPEGRHVIVGVGAVRGFVLSNRADPPLVDEVERVWALRETRARVHQARFRGLVLPAYGSPCAIRRLKEVRLLDAAHIIPDRDPEGVAGRH
jgi:putative restriction endonuclease